MIINYLKRWGKDGTCYSQTIKIDNWLKEEYNRFLMNKKIDIDDKFFKSHCYSDYDLKIKTLEYLEKGVNFTNLIHLGLFLELIIKLNKQGYNFNVTRILDRNTIIDVL